jgi:hypothetical protein
MPDQEQPDLLERMASLIGEPGEDTEAKANSVDASTEDAPEVESETEVSSDEETPEEESDEESEETPVEETPEALETIAQLAKVWDMEPDALLANLKLDGPDGSLIPLSDIVSGYRSAAAGGALKVQVEARAKELEVERATMIAERDQKFGALQTLTAQLVDAINAEPAVDWDALKTEDPLGYLKLKEERREKHEIAQAAIREMQAEATRISADRSKAFLQYQTAESAKFIAAMPELKDEGKRKEASDMIVGYLTTNEIPYEQFQEIITDHRVMQTVLKAARWDALQGKAKLTTAALKKAPPIVLPARARTDAPSKGKLTADLRKQLRRTGSERVAAKLIEGMI